MLYGDRHLCAVRAPSVAPQGPSSGRASTAGASGGAATLVPMTGSEAVAALESATARPTSNVEDSPTPSRTPTRRSDMVPPDVGFHEENPAATVTVVPRVSLELVANAPFGRYLVRSRSTE